MDSVIPEKTHSGRVSSVFHAVTCCGFGFFESSKKRTFKLDRRAVAQGRVKTIAVVDFFN